LAGGVYGNNGDDLESLTLDQVRAHHAAMIDPSRLTLVVSSDLDPDDVLEVVRAGFAWSAAGNETSAAMTPCHPESPSRQQLTIHEDSEQAWIIMGIPLADVPPNDAPALELGVAILSERLADQLREREGLAYSIGAIARVRGEGPAVMMSAGTRVENLERMEAGMLEVVADFLATPPTEEAVEAARNSREGRLRMRRLSRMGQAYAMAMAELRDRDPAALDAGLPALRAVTSEDVARVSRRWLSFESPAVAIAQ
jgi:zinc protease